MGAELTGSQKPRRPLFAEKHFSPCDEVLTQFSSRNYRSVKIHWNYDFYRITSPRIHFPNRKTILCCMNASDTANFVPEIREILAQHGRMSVENLGESDRRDACAGRQIQRRVPRQHGWPEDVQEHRIHRRSHSTTRRIALHFTGPPPSCEAETPHLIILLFFP